MTIDISSYIHGEPCAESDFKNAAHVLGHPLPEELVRIYEMADGFRGPTNAAFLYPLINPQPFNQETAVGFTQYLRTDPSQPHFWRNAIAFGDYGVGATWGININSGEVFEWWPEDGEETTVLGTSILEVFADKKKWYDELA